MNAFYDTKTLFVGTLNFTEQLSYEDWMKINPDYKAAALFVNYFTQIYGAWNKCKSFYTPEEDGVSTVLQYLQKNVPVIENDPKRYSPAYIYRVAYNCLYCVCHDLKKPRDAWENETSNIIGCGEDELDLFDLAVDVVEGDMASKLTKIKFWKIIKSLDPKATKVLNHILNGEPLEAVSKCSKKYKADPLRDVEVKLEEVETIMNDIRGLLAAFKSEFYI